MSCLRQLTFIVFLLLLPLVANADPFDGPQSRFFSGIAILLSCITILVQLSLFAIARRPDYLIFKIIFFVISMFLLVVEGWILIETIGIRRGDIVHYNYDMKNHDEQASVYYVALILCMLSCLLSAGTLFGLLWKKYPAAK